MRITRTVSTYTSVLFIIALFTLSGIGSAGASTAILVNAHGFAKQISYNPRGVIFPVNQTSIFSQDDKYVFAFITATFYNADFVAKWYDPSGQLYSNQVRHVDCVASPCTVSFRIAVAGTPAAMRPGVWRLDVLLGGSRLYSDNFTLTPVILQEDNWTFQVTQSAPPRVHGYLAVVIHPNNGTWKSYTVGLPYAANVTAYEPSTNRSLRVMTLDPKKGLILVDFATPQSEGYTFVVSFDVAYGSQSFGGWGSGNFAFSLQEYWWQRLNDIHPVPETYNITLPRGASLVDAIGVNVMALDYSVATGITPSVSFSTTLLPGQRFGWTIIYHDYTYQLSLPYVQSTTSAYLPLISGQLLPVIPLSLGSVSLWSAVMSVFLLTGSELLSPIYARTGILINRRRLRVAALILVAIFLISTVYQIVISQSAVFSK